MQPCQCRSKRTVRWRVAAAAAAAAAGVHAQVYIASLIGEMKL
jgi:hypothetical protein